MQNVIDALRARHEALREEPKRRDAGIRPRGVRRMADWKGGDAVIPWHLIWIIPLSAAVGFMTAAIRRVTMTDYSTIHGYPMRYESGGVTVEVDGAKHWFSMLWQALDFAHEMEEGENDG